MPQQYTSSSNIQFCSPIPEINFLWSDNDWIVEESLTGYRCIFSIEKSQNTLFTVKKQCGAFGLGKNLSFNFEVLKNMPLYAKLGHCTFDAVLVSANKKDLDSLFDIGGVGSEKLLDRVGFKLILVDVLMYAGVDLSSDEWSIRRTYLKECLGKINSPYIGLSEAISTRKQEFYDALKAKGSKGVIFKNVNGLYRPGITRNFLEIVSTDKGGFKNATLDSTWEPWDKESAEGFDFNHYLAVQGLNTPENLKKLQS